MGAALLLICARARAGAEVLENSWAKVLMADSHIGWRHVVVTREDDTVTTDAEEYMKLERWGAQVEARVRHNAVETRSGGPLSFTQDTLMSAKPQRTVGRIGGGKLILATTVMDKTRTVELDWKKGAVLDWGAEIKVLPLLKSKGSVGFWTFNPELGEFVEVKVEHAGREEVQLPGGARTLHKLKVTGLMPGITIHEYRDDRGILWKSAVQALKMETIRCDEKEAKAVAGRGPDVDLFMIQSNVRFMQPRRVEEATYELDLPGENLDLGLDGQEIIGRDGSRITLRVRPPSSTKRASLPLNVPGMGKYLADTSMLQAGHPLIGRLAKEAAGGETDALRAALRLEKWVHRNIKLKGFDVGFATALEVAVNRAGDCSEHAVLLCALARALGIPSRAVAGVVYWEAGKSRATFGYHMWTEVYLGEWVALDATLGLGRTDATHIKFVASAFEEGRAMGDLAVGLISVLGNAKLRVKEYRIAGMLVVPGEGHTEWRVRGRRYLDLKNCLSLEIPKGWTACLRGSGMLKKWDAAVELVPKDGSCRITVTSTRNPPGGQVKHVLRELQRVASVKEVSRWTIDGEEAVTARFSRGGEEREAVMVVDEDVRHVMRLKPWTPEGSRALREIAASVRFVGKAGQ